MGMQHLSFEQDDVRLISQHNVTHACNVRFIQYIALDEKTKMG